MIKTKNLFYYDTHPTSENMAGDVHEGLNANPKKLSPKYFYDAFGSQLFDQICDLPEYYPTRTEIGILKEHGEAMAERIGSNVALIELGSGSSLKIRVLLEALRPKIYAPLDISGEHLQASAGAIADDYDWLEVHAVCIDYSNPWTLPVETGDTKRAAFFPGSSIGNFEPDKAVHLLRQVAGAMGPGGGLLIGVDLKKDPAILNAAYNDSQGVTAAFNLNVLTHINEELGGDFNIDQFRHKAFYNQTLGRIEMHLESLKAQQVTIDGRTYSLAAGELIHTESSYKYTVDEFHQLVGRAGFKPVQVWTDEDDLFSIHYLEA